jgi:hypothetical protein
MQGEIKAWKNAEDKCGQIWLAGNENTRFV